MEKGSDFVAERDRSFEGEEGRKKTREGLALWKIRWMDYYYYYYYI